MMYWVISFLESSAWSILQDVSLVREKYKVTVTKNNEKGLLRIEKIEKKKVNDYKILVR